MPKIKNPMFKSLKGGLIMKNINTNMILTIGSMVLSGIAIVGSVIITKRQKKAVADIEATVDSIVKSSTKATEEAAKANEEEATKVTEEEAAKANEEETSTKANEEVKTKGDKKIRKAPIIIGTVLSAVCGLTIVYLKTRLNNKDS